MALVSLAGPVSNLLLGFVAAFTLALVTPQYVNNPTNIYLTFVWLFFETLIFFYHW